MSKLIRITITLAGLELKYKHTGSNNSKQQYISNTFMAQATTMCKYSSQVCEEYDQQQGK